eukprot:COSAG05_NODE_2243_length_3350_cov_1.245463_3_plen_48_part_00
MAKFLRARWTLNGRVMADIGIGDYFSGMSEAFVTVKAMAAHQRNFLD